MEGFIIKVILIAISINLANSRYCHVTNGSCPPQRVLGVRREVNDPAECLRECDRYKEVCVAVEYYKGVCTLKRNACEMWPLQRSPESHYYYQREDGQKCFGKNDTDSHVNIARGQPAYQSGADTGAMPIGEAAFAVDGNSDSDYAARSCSQTRDGVSPYWFVDLGQEQTVTSVSITNRNDALRVELNDFIVAVTNFVPGGRNNATSANRLKPDPMSSKRTQREQSVNFNDICMYKNETLEKEIGFLCYKPITGRYVLVQLLEQHGKSRVLSLCEVEVYTGVAPNGFIDGDSFDVARGRPAYQISTAGSPKAPATLAIDGNHDQDFNHGSCSATDWVPNPWWAVDLQGEYKVKGVRLVNRNDCCADRLSNILIAVTTSTPIVGEHYYSSGNETCTSHTAIIFSEAYLPCTKPLTGSHVIVTLVGSYRTNRQLTLCEVNVYTEIWN